jgi:hypothetical protein
MLFHLINVAMCNFHFNIVKKNVIYILIASTFYNLLNYFGQYINNVNLDIYNKVIIIIIIIFIKKHTKYKKNK